MPSSVARTRTTSVPTMSRVDSARGLEGIRTGGSYLLLTLAVLTTMEVASKAARRSLAIAGLWPLWKRRQRSRTTNEKELDVELWQEKEQAVSICGRIKEPISHDGYH